MLEKIRIFIVVFLIYGLSVTPSTGKTPVVVIDAGHGGRNPGAVWGELLEKDINLAVALMAGEKLGRLMPQAKIIYTRTTDVDVPLKDRTEIANHANADLFISIHCNANPSTSAAGSETYVMGVDKSGANLAVAMRENAVITLEDNFTESYGGYDPKSAESFIIFSLMQYAHQDQSLGLASEIQKQYTAGGALRSRGVKQDGFLVLWRTAMPSVLTEIGFISNPADRQYISSTNGQKTIATSIATAAQKFLNTTDYTPSTTAKSTQKSAPRSTAPETRKTTTLPYTPTGKSTTTSPETEPPTVVYRVQIQISRTPIPINSTNFGPWVVKINEYKTGNLYKYSIGNAVSYKDALNLQHRLRKTYEDCFVVAFAQGQQISLEKAKQLIEK